MRITVSSIVDMCAALGRELQRWWDSAIGPYLDRERLSSLKLNASVAKKAPVYADDAFVPEGLVVYAIGDVHGRADLLQKLMELIRLDMQEAPSAQPPVIVFLGDYVDRGFQSKAVLDFLSMGDLSDFEPRFLKGNHEAALLEFLSDSGFGPRWAEFGGVETLVSYGVRPPRNRTDLADWARARDDLDAALPMEHRNFLNILELNVTLGDYEFVHAGVDPHKSLDAQTEQDLLWIREAFLQDRARLSRIVVHGHTPEPAPHRDHRRIGLDTGAYLSGKLAAGRFEGNKVRFITTG